MFLTEHFFVNLLRELHELSDGTNDGILDLGRRNTRYGSRSFGLTLKKRRGQIVSIFDAAPSGMTRTHAIAPIINYQSHQQCLGLQTSGCVIVQLCSELGLNSSEQRPLDDSRLLSRQYLSLEDNFSHIKTIAKQMGQHSAPERDATYRPSGAQMTYP